MQSTTAKILILGDGNFSFTQSVSKLLFKTSPPSSHALTHLGLDDALKQVEITATSFDIRTDLLEKYQEIKDIFHNLESNSFNKHVKILHGINAWELRKHFGHVEKFDVVLWNHPHLGTEDFRLHRFLMSHFFASVKDVLNLTTGSVCISLVKGQHLRWDIVDQALSQNFAPVSVEPFLEKDWPGYEVKRNQHGKSFKSATTRLNHSSDMSSLAFRFQYNASERQEAKQHINNNQIEKSQTSDSTPRRRVDKTDSEKLAALPIEVEEKKKLYPCPTCSRSLLSERGLKNHIHMTHVLKKFGEDWQNNPEKKEQCSKCPKKFRYKADLDDHTISKHTSIDKDELPDLKKLMIDNDLEKIDEQGDYIPCLVCGQAIVNKEWGMKLHLESLKPALGLKMECPKCKNAFLESRALIQHYKFCRLKN